MMRTGRVGKSCARALPSVHVAIVTANASSQGADGRMAFPPDTFFALSLSPRAAPRIRCCTGGSGRPLRYAVRLVPSTEDQPLSRGGNKMAATTNVARERLARGQLSLGVGLRQARTVDIAKAMRTA